jgi:protein-tyrosine phosphatase
VLSGPESRKGTEFIFLANGWLWPEAETHRHIESSYQLPGVCFTLASSRSFKQIENRSLGVCFRAQSSRLAMQVLGVGFRPKAVIRKSLIFVRIKAVYGQVIMDYIANVEAFQITLRYKFINKRMFIWLRIVCFVILGCVFITGCDSSTESDSTNSSLAQEAPVRGLDLDGQSNFRDLGGYVTADGRSVRWGQVYRSGRLSSLSDSDVARITETGIRSVVNFLTTEEVEADGPDRLPEGVKETPLPMEAGNMNDLTALANHARQTGDFSAFSPEINPYIHRQLMVEGRKYYAQLLRELANPENRPLVFHCSHGVHRTGTAAAILLSALGVPWETIREDYLLSNAYRQEEIDRRLQHLKTMYAQNNGLAIEEVDATNMEAFYVLQGQYIDASLEQAISDFGSMDAYIHEGLGLSDEEIEGLKAQLLTD